MAASRTPAGRTCCVMGKGYGRSSRREAASAAKGEFADRKRKDCDRGPLPASRARDSGAKLVLCLRVRWPHIEVPSPGSIHSARWPHSLHPPFGPGVRANGGPPPQAGDGFEEKSRDERPSAEVATRTRRGAETDQELQERVALTLADHRVATVALVNALARAFHWKRMLWSGEFTTIAELAEREGIAPSYMTRVLRMTPLVPDDVEAIVDCRQGPELTLARMKERCIVDPSMRRLDWLLFTALQAVDDGSNLIPEVVSPVDKGRFVARKLTMSIRAEPVV
jgi:hypothetical protein